jgi:hypothetical protein
MLLRSAWRCDDGLEMLSLFHYIPSDVVVDSSSQSSFPTTKLKLWGGKSDVMSEDPKWEGLLAQICPALWRETKLPVGRQGGVPY